MRPIAELKLSNIKPAPTIEEIENLEKLFKVTLPTAYREFLKDGNGGHPELDTFRTNTGEEWAVNNFFFAGPPDQHMESMVWNYVNRWPKIPPNFVPIARDGFDNLFLLRCQVEQNGQVWIWVHDEPDSQLKQLTSSFADFVDRLQINPDYI